MFTLQSASGAEKYWTITFKPNQTQTVTISANVAYKLSGAVSEDHHVTLISQPARISGFRTNRSSISFGDTVTLTITTNAQANNVWVSHDNRTSEATVSRTSRTTKTWTLSIAPASTQSITAYANTSYNETGAVSRSININVGNQQQQPNQSQRAAFNSASAQVTQTWLQTSTTLTVTAQTNSATQYVWFEYGGHNYELNLQSTDGSGNKNWTGTYSWQSNVTFTNNNLVLFADTSRYGKDVSRNVTVGNTSTGTGSIITAEGKQYLTSTMVGSFIYFEVTTDANVARVQVIDGNTGQNLVRDATSSTPSGNNRMFWVDGFEMTLYTGQFWTYPRSMTYTVIAYNQNGQEVERKTIFVQAN
jgi:hypothetical protein